VVFVDDDGFGGGANLTVVVLLVTCWTAPSSFLVFSSVLLREDVDLLREEDDLFMSSGSNRRCLCDAALDLGLVYLSMPILLPSGAQSF
jgi:hypothetical protein